METNEKLFAIRICYDDKGEMPSNRFIQWIDECWYETDDTPIFGFEEKQLATIQNWLRSHFVTSVRFVEKSGTETIWTAFGKKETPKPKVKITFKFTKK